MPPGRDASRSRGAVGATRRPIGGLVVGRAGAGWATRLAAGLAADLEPARLAVACLAAAVLAVARLAGLGAMSVTRRL